MEIQCMVYSIRGCRVMVDSDLAKLYGVETKRLVEQVKRNLDRFPSDFMLICDIDELDDLRSQFATSNRLSDWNYKRRSAPMLFTENGVAMLSSVLNSKQAIQVNISIMRVFTKLRSFYALEDRLDRKVNNLEESVTKVFKIVFERLDDLDERKKHPIKKKKIGLKK